MRSLTEHPLRSLLILACTVHLLLVAYEACHHWAPFLQGDRSYGRLEALRALLATPMQDVLNTMVHGNVIPSEYLFQLPFYGMAGIPAVILFQIVLTIFSVLCVGKLAASFFQSQRAAFIAGAIYLLLPQNLVYAHQFVTEAIATPFMVYALYFTMQHLKHSGRNAIMYAGLFLGLAIFVRPSLALLLPGLLALACIYKILPLRAVGMLCIVSMVPLALWMATFTAVSGKIGYTNGVANLGWNLRSKVFLVDQANGFTKHEEVKSITSYEDLYRTTDSIGIGRFMQIASEHPAAYIKLAVTDAAIVFGKGNATKLMVDYFGIARDTGIKGWRDIWEQGGASGLARWAMGNLPMLLVFAFEIVWSLVTLVLAVAVIFFTCRVLLSTRYRMRLGQAEAAFTLIMAALLLTVLASAEMVDRAQARLRHPAEAGMILLAGIMLRTKRENA